MLPAHASTTDALVCCEGVFCRVEFGDELIGGKAAVTSGCKISMEGDSAGGDWSGSGNVAEDGSFAFTASFTQSDDAQVTGTVTADCSCIIGEFDFGSTGDPLSFSGSVNEGLTSIDDCPPDFSDIRLKTNIEILPTSRQGYNLYKFQYIDDKNENTYVGVMAQDVISRNPEAVVQNESGFYMVRYAQLGLKMVTFDEWESEDYATFGMEIRLAS